MLRTIFNLSGIIRIKMNSTIIALVLIVCLASFVSGKSIFVQCNFVNNDKKLLNGIDTKAGNTALLLQIQLEERQPYLENKKNTSIIFLP